MFSSTIPDDSKEGQILGRDIQIIGFSAISLLILIYTVPQVGHLAYTTYSNSINAPRTPKQVEKTQAWLVVQTVAIVLQLALVIETKMKAQRLQKSTSANSTNV